MPREAADKETVILLNPVDKMASVWTYDRPLQKYIEERLHIEPNLIHGQAINNGGKDYDIPKKFVLIRAPRKMNLTDKQRKAIGKRLNKTRLATK